LIVGREAELAMLGSFLATPPSALLLRGEPGAGKTTLWEAGVAMAEDQGLRVLRSRPSEAEAQLSLACLGDLLDGVEEEALAALPRPQSHALEVALLREAPGDAAPDPRAVAVALLGALRVLSRSQRVLVAIDDLHWLDAASRDALSFAARRLDREAVWLLLSQRPGSSSPVVSGLERRGVRSLDLAGLSLGAVRSMLLRHLDLSLPRWALRRLHESTGGNALFAVEMGRVLAERGVPEAATPWPVPDDVQAVVADRISRLSPATRELLLAAALSARPDLETLRDVVGRELDREVTSASEAGIARVSDGTLAFAHPLHAAAVVALAGTDDLRSMHQRLATATHSAEERPLHLALGLSGPDENAAAELARAAYDTFARGAPSGAAELALHAVRLTPESSPDRPDRLLALCEYLMVAGEPTRAHALLARVLETLPEGRPRARAHLLLSDGRITLTETGDHFAHIEEAARHAHADPSLRAIALARRAQFTALACVARLSEAEAWSLEALELARQADASVEGEALQALAWTRALQGKPIDDLQIRFDALGDATEIVRSPTRVQAERHGYRGELDEARAILSDLASRAEARGEDWSLDWLRMNRCELELRAGDWSAAARILDAWSNDPDESLTLEPARARCRAFLASARGEIAECERRAAEALVVDSVWNRFEVARARSLAALLDGRPADAAALLGPIWAHLEREGVSEPGVFPIAADLVEALVLAADLHEAARIVDRLQLAAIEQNHPWALATASRCAATLRLATGGDASSAAELASAADALHGLGLRFDHARCLLALGRAERRLRRRAAARRTLERAAAAFDEQGATGWAELARLERDRISGRRPRGDDDLTPSERRVVELAARGLSNKEIAGSLTVSVHTVEVHLSHAYRKLGVRSRAQLAGRLAAAESPSNV
jgi:DNA-binding CsgD family transcriptional regulator